MSAESPLNIRRWLQQSKEEPTIKIGEFEKKRLRFVLYATLLIWLFAGGRVWWQGHLHAAVSHLLVFAGTAFLLWLWWDPISKGDRYKIGHFILFQGCAGVFSGTLFSGMWRSPSFWALLLIPLFASLTLRLWQAVLWTSISLLIGAFLFFGEPWLRHLQHYDMGVYKQFLGFVVLLLSTLVFSMAFRFGMESSIRLVRVREEEVKAHAAEAEKQAQSLELLRDQALEASRAKSAFLANMSHEIRTPLNGVLGMASVLLRSSLNAEQQEMVATIDRSGQALLALLNDILDFSKIEAGQIRLEKRPFVVRTCIEDVLELLSPDASRKGLDLYLEFAPNVPHAIVGDELRLRQVLVNLVGNAIKFTVEGEVEIKVLWEKGSLYCAVRDTGIGIAEERKSQLFQAFEQLDASMTRMFGGTGLGLSISRHLVDLMDGEIEVKSKEDEGSTFSFSVAAPESDEIQPVERDLSLFEDRSVLLVEARRGTREVIAAELQRLGMKVYATGSLSESYLLMERHDFHVCLLGAPLETVLAHVDNLRSRQACPVLWLASAHDRGAETSVHQQRLNGILLRPVRLLSLIDLLLFVLEERSPSLEVVEQVWEVPMAEKMPLSMMVAEDNPINRQVVGQMLQEFGYQADFAEDGREVLCMAQTKTFDVIFMDMHMPLMDGVTATQELRLLPNLEKQPYIVALTADVMPTQRKVFEDAGCDDFLSKPLQMEALRAALERYAETISHPILEDLRAPATIPGMSFVSTSVSAVSSPNSGGMAILGDPFERLRMLCADSTMSLEKLVEDHIANSLSLLQRMKQASLNVVSDDFALAAHSLKSTSAMFGAMHVSLLSRELESLAKEDDMEEATLLLVKLESALEEAHSVMRTRVTQPV